MREVVGVVGDVKQGGLAEARRRRLRLTREPSRAGLTIVLRARVPPLALSAAAAAIVRASMRTSRRGRADDGCGARTLGSRRSARPSWACSRPALLLASVGIYSVLAYIVRGRSREIGIRTALGARTLDVLRLVVMEGMTPALIGIVLGAVAALGAARRFLGGSCSA